MSVFNASTLEKGGLIQSLFRFIVNKSMIPPTNSYNVNNDFIVINFIDKAVSNRAQFDFVDIIATTQLTRRVPRIENSFM